MMSLHTFNKRSRPSIFHKLAQEKFDLLVIGGGITGASIFRDGALRGMKVALVEAKDFASATSGRTYAVPDIPALAAQAIRQPVSEIGDAHDVSAVPNQPVRGVWDPARGEPFAARARLEVGEERAEVVVGKLEREGHQRLAPLREFTHERAIGVTKGFAGGVETQHGWEHRGRRRPMYFHIYAHTRSYSPTTRQPASRPDEGPRARPRGRRRPAP